MKILVTGAAGRLGHDLVERLLEADHEVWGVDPQVWRGELRPHRFDVVDLRDRSTAYRVVEGAEVVIHMGEASNIIKGLPPSETFQRNTLATSNLFEACAELGVRRIVYTSSCQVYGMSFPGGPSYIPPQYLPFDEQHPVQPDNFYAAAKVAGEMAGRLVQARFGVAFAGFRLPAIYRPDPRRPLHQKAWLCGFGTFLDYRDAVQILQLAAESDRTGYEIYHTTADQVAGVGLREYLSRHPDFPALPEDFPDDASPMLSDKAKAHFDWAPHYNRMVPAERN